MEAGNGILKWLVWLQVTGVNPVGMEEANMKMEEEGTNKAGADQVFPPKT